MRSWCLIPKPSTARMSTAAWSRAARRDPSARRRGAGRSTRSDSPKWTVSFRQSSFTALPPVSTERCRDEPARKGDGQVGEREPALAFLAEPLCLQHHGRERRERAQRRRPREQQRVAGNREAGEQAEAERAEQVDGERPERELAAGGKLDERVELEARQRADAAEQRRADPDERASPRHPPSENAREVHARRGPRRRSRPDRPPPRPPRRGGRARSARSAASRTSSARRRSRCRASGRRNVEGGSRSCRRVTKYPSRSVPTTLTAKVAHGQPCPTRAAPARGRPARARRRRRRRRSQAAAASGAGPAAVARACRAWWWPGSCRASRLLRERWCSRRGHQRPKPRFRRAPSPEAIVTSARCFAMLRCAHLLPDSDRARPPGPSRWSRTMIRTIEVDA